MKNYGPIWDIDKLESGDTIHLKCGCGGCRRWVKMVAVDVSGGQFYVKRHKRMFDMRNQMFLCGKHFRR